MTPVEWCGAWIFFLSQGGAVIAEGIFTSVTGRKVKGRWGRVWSLLVIVCIGCLAGKNWCVRRGTTRSPASPAPTDVSSLLAGSHWDL